MLASVFGEVFTLEYFWVIQWPPDDDQGRDPIKQEI